MPKRSNERASAVNVRPIVREGDVLYLLHCGADGVDWAERGHVENIKHSGRRFIFVSDRKSCWGCTFNQRLGRFEAGLVGFPVVRRLPKGCCEQTGLPVDRCNCYQHCDSPDDLAERAREI